MSEPRAAGRGEIVTCLFLLYFYFTRLRSARLEPILLHAIGLALLAAFLANRL